MIPRLRAFVASTMACMSTLRVLRVTLRAFAVVTPGVFNITTMFVVHELRGLQRVH